MHKEDTSAQIPVVTPIKHFSKSSLLLLLRNPLMFKMRYILGVYDDSRSMSALVGSACHEALKVYYGAHESIVVPADDDEEAVRIAHDAGLAYLFQYPDEMIDFGKTGSREIMLKRYENGIQFYFDNEPAYEKLVIVEKKIDKVQVTTRYGEMLPLRITAIPDLVHELADGSLEVIDTKFSSKFTSQESEDGGKIMEAMFLKHAVEAETGQKVTRVVFREIKVVENKDKSVQVKDWVIPADHEPYDIIFYNLFRDACKFVQNPNAIYLPNPSDMFDGEEAWTLYAQGLINANMEDVEMKQPTVSGDILLSVQSDFYAGLEYQVNVNASGEPILTIGKKKTLKAQKAQLIEDNPNAKVTYSRKTKQFKVAYQLMVDVEK